MSISNCRFAYSLESAKGVDVAVREFEDLGAVVLRPLEGRRITVLQKIGCLPGSGAQLVEIFLGLCGARFRDLTENLRRISSRPRLSSHGTPPFGAVYSIRRVAQRVRRIISPIVRDQIVKTGAHSMSVECGWRSE